MSQLEFIRALSIACIILQAILAYKSVPKLWRIRHRRVVVQGYLLMWFQICLFAIILLYGSFVSTGYAHTINFMLAIASRSIVVTLSITKMWVTRQWFKIGIKNGGTNGKTRQTDSETKTTEA